MQKILKAIYEGELRIEDAEVKNDPEYKKAMASVLSVQQRLIDALPDDKRGLIDELSMANGAVNGIVCRQDFTKGYQLGALLMLAVFTEPLE